MITFNPLSKDPEEIERMWYVRAEPQFKAGWLLYSSSFILETLQGCVFSPQKVKRTAGWQLGAGAILACVAVAQFVVMALSYAPVLNWFVYVLVRNLPRNSAGFFFRACYWKTRLGQLGVDCLIDQGVEFTNPARIRIGNRCHLDRDVLLSVGNDDGYIILHDYVFVGPSCHMAGRGGVDIGSFVGLSARVHIYSVTNVPYDVERPGELITMSHTVSPDHQSTVVGKVSIGDYAVIGLGAMILPNVAIGRGAVVHAYSEVSSSFPNFAVVSGHGRATQKGWRRPGRLDPRLAAAPSNSQPSLTMDAVT